MRYPLPNKQWQLNGILKDSLHIHLSFWGILQLSPSCLQSLLVKTLENLLCNLSRSPRGCCIHKLCQPQSSPPPLHFYMKERRQLRTGLVTMSYNFFLSRATKGNSNPRLKGNRKGIIVKGKEFYIPILNTFPTR